MVASRDGRDGSVIIHQDAAIFASNLVKGQTVDYALGPGRHAWVQVIGGKVEVNHTPLDHGDGAAVSDQPTLQVKALDDAELLLFDLS